MAGLQNFLNQVEAIVWGVPLLVLLLITGVFLTIRLNFVQIRLLPYSIKQIFARNNDKKADGDISHFQALMTAMAATIGVGNIVGVATAITLGGPGAIFWLVITGVLSMPAKYGEAILAVKYRVTDAKGEKSGGPMYYIEQGLNQKWLAVLFAIFGTAASFGIGNGIQSKAIADSMDQLLSVPHWVTGIGTVILAGIVIIGGIKSIGRVTSFLVPIVVVFYVGSGLVIMIMNSSLVPETIGTILKLAFSGEAAVGGTVGAVIRFGVARAIASTEAGMGASAMAAAAAKTDMPGRQALVSMTQVFFDSIVCTITGITIVMSGLWTDASVGADQLTGSAFGMLLGGAGPTLISIALLFLAFSTILGWSYYGEKCLQYLFKNYIAVHIYRLVFVLFIFVGATANLEAIWTLSDILNALMAIPNLIGLIGLSGVIVLETRKFAEKIKEEQATAKNKAG